MFKGDRLRTLRINKGLNQHTLADMLGVSKSLISCYENGKRKPTIENIIAFMEIFGVSSDYLLGSDNLVKTVENCVDKFKSITNEEILFIEQLRKNKLVYESLFTEPKKGAEIIIKKLS
ncbi:MAG: helix-turn-helix transcriptional regulator [Bacilli bacterium]|nr:helix-turn-helix transcriptional regulator [Bacilli bacterium]